LKKLNYFRVYTGLPREIYIFFIAKVITCMGMFIMPLWALILTQKIGLTKPQAGLMTTLFAITQAPCLLFGGKLIDRIGRKKVIFFAQTIGTMIYIACAVIPMNMLTAILIIIASDFYTVASPALDALMADVTNPENRKASFSLIYFGLNLGYTISPLLGGLLFQHYLPLLFALDAVTTMISNSLIMIYVKEPEFNKKDKVLPEINKEDQEKISVLKVLWNTRVLLYFMLIMFIYQFCYSQWSFMLPLQMADLFLSNGARNYSFLVAINAATVITFTPLATVATQKFRSLTIMAIGGLCYCISFFIFGLIIHMPLFLPVVFVMTIGEILITVNINTFMADQTPSSHRGRVNSLSSIIQGACYVIAPLIMSNVIVMTNYLTAWWIIAAFMLSGTLSMFALDKKSSRLMKTAPRY
jgi:MFS family permease